MRCKRGQQQKSTIVLGIRQHLDIFLVAFFSFRIWGLVVFCLAVSFLENGSFLRHFWVGFCVTSSWVYGGGDQKWGVGVFFYQPLISIFFSFGIFAFAIDRDWDIMRWECEA